MDEQRRKVDGLARTLAEIREELAGVKSIKEHTKAVLDRSRIAIQYAIAAINVREVSATEGAAKSDLADALADLYRGMPKDEIEKQHPAAHQIRRPVMVVYNEDDAKKYCMERHQEFLVLDKKKFETFARKSGADLRDLVELKEGLSVTIKSDLSELLK